MTARLLCLSLAFGLSACSELGLAPDKSTAPPPAEDRRLPVRATYRADELVGLCEKILANGQGKTTFSVRQYADNGGMVIISGEKSVAMGKGESNAPFECHFDHGSLITAK